MTEITRVPLQPIAKGALTKLWLGVAAVALAAGGLAYATMPASVEVDVVKAGTGPSPKPEDVVFVKYTGKLKSGKVFQQTPSTPFPVPGILPDGVPLLVGNTVPGFTQGLLKMQKGGKYKLSIPAEMGYGKSPPEGSDIPPDAELIFDIELVEIMSQPEAEQRFQMAQQLMQQAEQRGGKGPAGAGGPGGAGAPPKPN